MNEFIVPGFGDRMLELFQGYSQTEIAQMLGVGKSAVTNYANDRVPKIQILFKIIELRECSLDWLILGKTPDQSFSKNPNLIEMLPDDLKRVTQDIADSGGISFEEAIVHLVTEALAMKGIGEMPGFMPVPVFQMMSEEIEQRVFQHLDNLPEPTRSSETKKLIGALVTRAAAP